MSARATISGLAIAAVFMGILCSLLATHQRRPFYLIRERHGVWAQGFEEVELRFRKGLSLTKPLVHLYNQVRWSLLGAMPHPVVLPGRDGFLFYVSEEAKDGPTMTDWRGEALPSHTELEQWCGTLAARDRQLAERGIPYLVAMAPNKQTAMPQWLPRWVQHQEGPHRADLMLPAVADLLRTPPLDLRPLFRAESAAGRATFFRTDSHWSPEGAALAAEAILHRLRDPDPRVQPINWRDWARISCDYRGDILNLGHIRIDAGETVLLPVPPRALPGLTPDGRPLLAPGGNQSFNLPAELWQPDVGEIKTLVLSNPTGLSGTLLVFHDSFGSAIVPYLGQPYQRTIACWTSWSQAWSQAIVDREAPTVVIQLSVERYLHCIGNSIPALAPEPPTQPER